MPWARHIWEESLPILAERGYIIPAVNTEDVDYVACARALANSIREWHPTAQVCLLTNKLIEDSTFTHIKTLPYGDQATDQSWKLSNDWQVFAASPFRQTVKLEADMLATSPIDHWWTLFERRDVVISTGCRDFYGNPSASRFYRRVFDVNNLPDVYNAVTYWRMSTGAREFFEWVRRIFTNWQQFKTLLKFSDHHPTTDLVYAVAAQVFGVDQCTLPQGLGPNIVHMKKHIVPIRGQDWTKELIWEHTNPGLRINTVAQQGLFHYHVKNWLTNESRNH